MESTTTSNSKAIDVPKRATPWIPSINVITHSDGSTKEGAVYRNGTMVGSFTSITRILSEAGIGPVIAWGDIAMIFHGIPTSYIVTNYTT
jgi:hypothetical protein